MQKEKELKQEVVKKCVNQDRRVVQLLNILKRRKEQRENNAEKIKKSYQRFEQGI